MGIWASQPQSFDNINITDNGSSISVNTGLDFCSICITSSDGSLYITEEFDQNYVYNGTTRPVYISVKHLDDLLNQNIPYLAVTGGTFTTNQNWIGKLNVLGDLVVDNGAVLNIEQGTQVLFEENTGIKIINGAVYADGTSKNKISFTSAKETPSVSDWDGIELSGSTTTGDFNFCNFSYATYGIKSTSSEPKIKNSVFSENSYGLRITDSYSNPNWNNIQISGNTFLNNSTYGIYLRNSSPAMSANISTGNKRGISHSTGANAIMENNQFDNSQYYGVLCYNSSPDYYYDSSEGNGGYNSIFSNIGHGVTITGNSNPEFGQPNLSYGGYNTIFDNDYEIFNLTNNYIIACNNWWGQLPHPQASDFYGSVRWVPYLDNEERSNTPPQSESIMFELDLDSNLPEDLQKAKFDQMIHNYEISSNDFRNHFIKNEESENSVFSAVNYVKSLGLYLKPEAVVSEIEGTLKFVKSNKVFSELLIQQADYLLRIGQSENALEKLKNAENYTSEKNNLNRIAFQKACLYIDHLNDYESGENILKQVIYSSDKSSPVYDLAVEELSLLKNNTLGFGKTTYVGPIVSGFELLGNYPNPFNPETNIRFNLPSQSEIKLSIYSLLGRHIKTIKLAAAGPGLVKVLWNSTNDFGEEVSSGIYFYTLDAVSQSDDKKYRAVSKMLLIR